MHSESAARELAWLSGKRIAIVGKWGSITRRQALQLCKTLGGVPVDRCDESTQLVVIGAEESPHAAESLLDAAAQARVASGELVVMQETELWQRLGYVEPQQDIRTLYTPALLAELLGVKTSQVRQWHRRGWIQAARELRRLPYFDFAEVAIARQLAELSSAGASTAAIERTLAELQRHAPEHTRPLAQLPIVVQGKQLLLWRGAELIEPSGQKRFDFSTDRAANADEDVTAVSIPLTTADQPVSVAELLAAASDCEQEGDLAAASDLYRAALVAGGAQPETCFLLAELLYRQGDLAAARERYWMAIELDEEFVEARANLACVLAELGERDLALDALSGALRYHPDYSDAHYHLARLLEEAARPAEARQHWQRFLELAPDSPWGDEARARVGEAGR